MNNLSEITTKYDALIIDVDGTLYNQNKVRIKMARDLIIYYIKHIKDIKELYAIFLYRKIREKNTIVANSIDDYIGYVSEKLNMDISKVEGVVTYWMLEHPLRYIKKYANKELIFDISNFEKDKTIIIYSDYPVEKKLEILNINADYIFYPNKYCDYGLKPSKKMMEYIIDKAKINPTSTLYVGDRKEKDGESAKLVQIDYYRK